VENGELPDTLDWLGHLVQQICYGNAKDYFGFEKVAQPAEAAEAR
ncbi:glucuronate isomerase, partial [Hymenobacter sp. BT175]